MNAIVFDRFGVPEEVLTLRDVPKPVPGRGQVLVRMLASPVNPSDLLYIEGRYTVRPTLPATPGFEGVGVVEATGGGLLGWLRKGKRVAVLNDRIGNWGEYTITSSRQVIPIPDDIPDAQAASFFVNPMTVLAICRSVLAIPRGERILLTAAGSALGRMILRLAKLDGFRVIATVRRREEIAELIALGAEAVLCEADGPIDEQAKALTAGTGVKYAMDCVGGRLGGEVFNSLAPGGHAVIYGALSGEPIAIDPRVLITGSKRVEGFWLGDWAKKQRVLRMLRYFRTIRRLMREGIFHTEIAGLYPLTDIRSAVQHAAQAGKKGKILLQFGNQV